MKLRFYSVALFLVLVSATIGLANDWPQFRGPGRDGISRETGFLKQWPAAGPAMVWTFDKAGVGYSGPAIAGDRLYMAGGRGDSEFIFALDLAGQPKEVWATRIGPIFQWKGNNWNMGPNVTPTVDGNRVYVLGGFGDLVCVETETGKELWRVNLPRDLGGEVNPIGGGLEEPSPLGWGYSSSPLVDGDRLIVVPGGKKGLIAALDKKSGKLLWQSAEVQDQASYSSPIIIDVGGVRQIVQVVNSGIVGVSAKDGKRLWAYHRQPAYDDVVISSPIAADGLVFASVGFQQGCDLIRVLGQGNEFRAEMVYSNKAIENRDGGLILHEGHLYGHSENRGWCCVEMKTGKVKWEEKRKLGRGVVSFADGHLICCAEMGGAVALVAATPAGWTEKGRFKLPRESTQRRQSGGIWTHPVIAHGKLYLRDQELLFCFDLTK
jgi:hypothetical protein